ncbi:MAG: F0F1 ATP synthase subunit A [Rickettsiales bacterium]|jgi:F-type H+-transporting ATPase subunit a|nr:F0F1 ATP synthase subunit A [Rickettsiales bacterium]
MNISTDSILIFDGFLKINATIFYTWIVMAIALFFAIMTRICLTHTKNIGKLQNFFEFLIMTIEEQIKTMGEVNIFFIFPFIATLFIFILMSNLLSIIPSFYSPTASLSTTAALAIIVVFSGYFYGIKRVGFFGFLKKFIKPAPFLLPLNIISDISSNCALAIRLYGNVMSGMILGAIVGNIVFLELGFPVFLHILDFMSSSIQAYIFSILSLSFMMGAEK